MVNRGLSVRETEMLVKKTLAAQRFGGKAKAVARDPDVKRLENQISEKLGAGVKIKPGKKGAGQLIISFNSSAELDGILEHLIGVNIFGASVDYSRLTPLYSASAFSAGVDRYLIVPGKAMKNQIIKVLVLQYVLGVIYLAVAGIWDTTAILSALTGCLAALVPKTYFSMRMLRTTEDKMRRSGWATHTDPRLVNG